MAITAATLTTTVSESITLNGQTFGNTITKTHSSIKDVMVRTVPVTAGTDLHVLYQSEPTNPELLSFVGMFFKFFFKSLSFKLFGILNGVCHTFTIISPVGITSFE